MLDPKAFPKEKPTYPKFVTVVVVIKWKWKRIN